MSVERWLPIPGAPGYEVSDLGRVRSFKRKEVRILRPAFGGRDGRPKVNIYRRTAPIHRLVALAFIGPPPPGQEVRHLDGDKLNNRLENLAYGTRSENSLDQVRHGVHNMASKTHCPQGHPYSEDNIRFEPRGRHCRTCDLAHRATYVAARSAARAAARAARAEMLPGGNRPGTPVPHPVESRAS